jgi:hypothetical protein
MEVLSELPIAIRKAQESLEPYIKQRNEAALVRRILASNLSSHINHDDAQSLSRPLSLLDSATDVEAPDHSVKGLQKEYIRCARANIKARKEFVSLSKEHQRGREDEGIDGTHIESPQSSSSSMENFLDVIRQRQRHESLRIVQDYIDSLCQKPAAATEHLDPRIVLEDVETLPKVPPEVLNAPSISKSSGETDMNALVDQLEKSVLRAKMLLKNEQKLLERVRSKNDLHSESHSGRLQALGATRNELISWIEAELAHAGESPPAVDDHEITGSVSRGKEYIDAQLSSIRRQYNRYTKSRQRLILAATGTLEMPILPSPEEVDIPIRAPEPYNSNNAHTIFPYLEQMVSISNDQKVMIQQKSYLTITLAKQLKEANQGLDRLAEESHLLPSHPMPTSSSPNKRTEAPVSFSDEMSSYEKPDSSRRAQTWVFAADSAGKATQKTVLGTLEEGTATIENARQVLEDLRSLLGDDSSKKGTKKQGGDIWSVLDCNLGVIKGEGAD